jgi:hypothetical protein
MPLAEADRVGHDGAHRHRAEWRARGTAASDHANEVAFTGRSADLGRDRTQRFDPVAGESSDELRVHVMIRNPIVGNTLPH